jgi:hypothetical protein
MSWRRKAWAMGFLGVAIVALILISASLSQLQFHAGQPFWLPDVAPGVGDQSSSSGAVSLLFLIVRAMLAFAVVGLPIYIVINLLSSQGRQRLLGDVIALAVIILLLSLLSRNAQAPEDQKTLLLGPPESQATPVPGGPPAEFTAHVPPWVDVLAAPTLAVVVSGAVVAILWWMWRRPEVQPEVPHLSVPSSPRDTLDHVAEQARATIDALQSGEAFDDTIIRTYVQLSRVIQRERALRRDKAMTPGEFEQFLIQRGFPAQPVRDLTRLFERARYGHEAAGEVEQRQAIASLEAIVAFCNGPGEV